MNRQETGFSASILGYKGMYPKIDPSAFLCEGVRIIGDVEIGKDCSVWYNSVIRGDVHYIKIGERTNVQDNCTLHVTNQKFALNIGSDVSIAHSVSLHGCTIHDYVLIGIGAIVLDGAEIHSESLIAAGSVVREGFVVPEGSLVAGVPGKVVRPLTEQEREKVRRNAANYVKYVSEYRNGLKNL